MKGDGACCFLDEFRMCHDAIMIGDNKSLILLLVRRDMIGERTIHHTLWPVLIRQFFCQQCLCDYSYGDFREAQTTLPVR
jgi:hypothetical protein